MPQFDIYTLNAQIFGLIIILFLFYFNNITNIIPNFIGVMKFRHKKRLYNKSFKINKNKYLGINWYIEMLKNKKS